MKHFAIYFFAIIALAACRQQAGNQNLIDHPPVKKHIRFTIDTMLQTVDTVTLSAIDTAFVVKNKLINDDIGDKQKNYIIDIYFTNVQWPKLSYKNAIGADLFLLGDLDRDGLPELLLRPEWFSSCWASVNLFSLKHNKWKIVKSGSMYFCSDQYPLGKRVVKTANGYALLTDSLADDKFITLKKPFKF